MYVKIHRKSTFHSLLALLSEEYLGIAPAVQWLGLQTSNASVTGLIPGQGTKIPQAAQHGLKRKKKEKHKLLI